MTATTAVEVSPRDGKFPRRQRILNVLNDPWLWAAAALLPEQDRSEGGRPRIYPRWAWLMYELLIHEFRSAVAVERELADPMVWETLRRAARELFPDQEAEWLPERPMPRHVYTYAKRRYLTNPDFIEAAGEALRQVATRLAPTVGICSAEPGASWTHPPTENCVYADGKVLTARTRQPRLDKTTGELRPRSEPDLELYVTGGGQRVQGIGFVLLAGRRPGRNERLIFDVIDAPRQGGELVHAMRAFERTLPLLPGAQCVLYDGAARGKHRAGIFALGKIPVSPRRRRDSPTPRERDFGRHRAIADDGSTIFVHLHLRDGAPMLKDVLDDGTVELRPLRRVKTTRPQGPRGRSYSEFALPDGRRVRIRHTSNDDDRARGFNREEHFHPFAAGDADYERLYARRNDAESGHRVLDDSLWRERAHSIGRRAIRLNLISWAAFQNAQTRALAVWARGHEAAA